MSEICKACGSSRIGDPRCGRHSRRWLRCCLDCFACWPCAAPVSSPPVDEQRYRPRIGEQGDSVRDGKLAACGADAE